MKDKFLYIKESFLNGVNLSVVKFGLKNLNKEDLESNMEQLKEVAFKQIMAIRKLLSTRIVLFSKKELILQIALVAGLSSSFITLAVDKTIDNKRKQQEKIAQNLKDAKILAAFDNATGYGSLDLSSSVYDKRAAQIMLKIMDDYENEEKKHNGKLRESILNMFSANDIGKTSISRRRIFHEPEEIWSVIVDGYMDDQGRYLYEWFPGSGPQEVAQPNGQKDVINKIKYAHEIWETRCMRPLVNIGIFGKEQKVVNIYNAGVLMVGKGDPNIKMFCDMAKNGIEVLQSQQNNTRYYFGRNEYLDVQNQIVAKYINEVNALIAEKHYAETVKQKRAEIIDIQQQDVKTKI